ncbi:hypothetical protein Hdeb2414_s0017g00504691 [Helianthus debilis subsp. tardiflorus]
MICYKFTLYSSTRTLFTFQTPLIHFVLHLHSTGARRNLFVLVGVVFNVTRRVTAKQVNIPKTKKT